MTKAAKLAQAATAAAEVRAHQTNPNVVALNVERIRTWVNVFFWVGITLGLTFTMANVQSFAAGGVAKYSVQWCIAWLLDPMVSLPLLGVLIGEQVLTRYNVKSGTWVHIVKWVTLSCTYAMNTWQAWVAMDPAKILLHSVPPLVVVCAAEGLTDLRHRITQAVTKAVEAAHRTAGGTTLDGPQDQSLETEATVPGPVPNGPQDRSPVVLDAVPGPTENGPQDHSEAVPGPVPATIQDRPQDHKEPVPADSQDRSAKRSQDRRKATPKASAKGRVTQAEWEKRVRKAIADHPGIDLNPSPIAAVLGLDQKTRASGGFKRAVTAVREETDGADHRLRAVNE